MVFYRFESFVFHIDFEIHYDSLLNVKQDNGFGEAFEAPLDTDEQVIRFINEDLH